MMAYVRRASSQRVQDCYQCGKCSAGCPMHPEMDLGPRMMMRALQLGLKGMVLNSNTIWLCLHCSACSDRCPQQIDVSAVMRALRLLAEAEGVRPAVPAVVAADAAFAGQVKAFGRVYEPGLAAQVNFRSGRPLQNAGLGLGMLSRGRLRLLPKRVKDRAGIKEIFRRQETQGPGTRDSEQDPGKEAKP